jgi:hypothetical protein
MMNLALKVAIVSGFVTAFVFRGGGTEERPAAASEPATPRPTTALEAPVASPARGISEAPSHAPVAPPNPTNAAVPVEIPETSQDLAASAFSTEVLRLSAEADEVDALWNSYKEKCGVRVSRHYDFGREWFSIWDRAAEASIDTPGCGEDLRRLRQAGEKVGRDILKARAMARQGLLDRGTEIGMLRWNAVQWLQFEEDVPRRSPRPASSPAPAPTRSADNQGARPKVAP